MDESLFSVLIVPVVSAIGIALGLLYSGIGRILAARMQSRVGPPITQPFRDVKKLLVKESIVPRKAVGWLFNLAPVVALGSSLVLLLYVPLGGFPPVLGSHGDLILVLYLLLLPSLALVVGGLSSGSPYAGLGARREIITMIGYEFPLAVAIVSIAWLLSQVSPGAAAFSFSSMTINAIWGSVSPLGFAGLLMLFAVVLFVMPGKTGRAPFDAPKADTEIAGGVLAEYSGRNLALFYIAEAVGNIVFASIIIGLFLPFGVSSFLGLSGIWAIAGDALFFLLKLLGIIFVGSVLMGVATARFRISRVVRVYWLHATMISLLGLMMIMIDMGIR